MTLHYDASKLLRAKPASFPLVTSQTRRPAIGQRATALYFEKFTAYAKRSGDEVNLFSTKLRVDRTFAAGKFLLTQTNTCDVAWRTRRDSGDAAREAWEIYDSRCAASGELYAKTALGIVVPDDPDPVAALDDWDTVEHDNAADAFVDFVTKWEAAIARPPIEEPGEDVLSAHACVSSEPLLRPLNAYDVTSLESPSGGAQAAMHAYGARNEWRDIAYALEDADSVPESMRSTVPTMSLVPHRGSAGRDESVPTLLIVCEGALWNAIRVLMYARDDADKFDDPRKSAEPDFEPTVVLARTRRGSRMVA